MRAQTVLVTGGSSGIGEAICTTLLARGTHVVNIDVTAPKQSAGDGYHYFQADLSDARQTREVADIIGRTFSVTGLVNNAGVCRPALVADVKDEDLDHAVDLHLRAAITLTKAVLPSMKDARYGRIVNMSSRVILGKPQRTVYGATKAALIAMTRAWAMELGVHGITVNAIAPGPILTPLFMRSNGAEIAQKLVDSTVVKRGGTPEDVAHSAAFFLSPDSGFVTGQVLHVCGGASLGTAVW